MTKTTTKQKLINISLDLMLAQGYNATSINTLCKKAGLTKGGFFHHFASKEALALATLDSYWQSRMELLEELRGNEENPLDKVMRHVDFVFEAPEYERNEFGCLMGVFALEMSLMNINLQSALEGKFADWKRLIVSDLAETEAKYGPLKLVSKEELADYMLSVFEGSILMARAHRNGKVIQTNVIHLMEHVQSLFTGKTH